MLGPDILVGADLPVDVLGDILQHKLGVQHTVKNVLEIEYDFYGVKFFHYKLPKSVGNTTKYYLEMNGPLGNSKIYLNRAEFGVFIEMIHHDGRIFNVSQANQRYMSTIMDKLPGEMVKQIVGVGYYLGKINSNEELNDAIERYHMDNYDPLDKNISFSYDGEKYECFGSIKQAGPSAYICRKKGQRNIFYITQKNFTYIQTNIRGELPVSLKKSIKDYNDSFKKKRRLLAVSLENYLIEETHTHSSSNSFIHHITITGNKYKKDFVLSGAEFSVFKKILKHQGTIFTPSKNDSRYMDKILEVLPLNTIFHIRGIGYFIGDEADNALLEGAKERHRINSVKKYQDVIKFSAYQKEYECLGKRSERRGDMYLFRDTSDTEINKPIWLSGKSFQLFKRLIVNVGDIIKVSRVDHHAIQGIRKAFGKEFIKTIPREGIYIGEKKVSTKKMKKKAPDKKNQKNNGSNTNIDGSIQMYLRGDIGLDEVGKNIPRGYYSNSPAKTQIATGERKLTSSRRRNTDKVSKNIKPKEALEKISFSSRRLEIKSLRDSSKISINSRFELFLSREEYGLIKELCDLGIQGKCKKLNDTDKKLYDTIIEKTPNNCPIFIDEIDAPGLVVSIGNNSYVKKGNDIFSSAK